MKVDRFISLCIIRQIQYMINSRYDLPKVKLRFKTDPSNNIMNSAQITLFQKFDANPSVFLDRLKNGKEIHDAYMRYRKLKKHNYIKQPSNRKKSLSLAQCEKMNTMVLKRQSKRSMNKLHFALQTTFLGRNQQGSAETIKKSKFYQFINKNGTKGEQQRMQDLLIDLKPQTVSLRIAKKMRNYPNLYQSNKNHVQLQGRLLQKKQDEKKYKINRFIKDKHQNRLIRQANVFKIDPWNEGNILNSFNNANSSDKYHYENDDF